MATKRRTPPRKSERILEGAWNDAGIATAKELAKETGMGYDNLLKRKRKPETLSGLQLAVIIDATNMDDKTLGDFFRALRKEVLK